MQSYEIKAEGVLALSGTKWIQVTERDKCAFLRLTDCSSQAGARALLAQRGIAVTSTSKANRLFEQIDQISEYSASPLVDHSGWNGEHFVLPDGTVISPSSVRKPVVVFETDQGKCQKSGSFKAWKRNVAEPLTGQVIPMFAVMLAFMPPLLRLSSRTGNFGFELVGPPGIGKTTVQLIASSVLGGIGRADDGSCYWTTFNSTLNHLESVMEIHSDLPMFIEEASLFLADESPAKRAAAFKAFAFRIGGGKDKERLNSPAGRTHRVSYLSSSNQTLASLIGEDTDVARAAGDRLITLELERNGGLGIFSKLPEGFQSTSAMARALIDAASTNHGHAIRKYLRPLVDGRANDEAGIRCRIAKLVQQFTERAGVDPNDGSAMRVAEAFGLVYAAGVIAQEFGVIPESWKCGSAVLRCYRHFRVGYSPPISFEDMLSALAAAPDALHLGNGDKHKPSAIDAAEVVVRHANGMIEIIISKDAIHKRLPAWRLQRRRPDVIALLQKERGRQTIKRKLHKSLPARRVYSFLLPEVST